jgi:hypothetical protein
MGARLLKSIHAHALRGDPNVFKDAGIHREYKKLTDEDSDPADVPGDLKGFREMPRERDVVELFKKLAGADPLPPA